MENIRSWLYTKPKRKYILSRVSGDLQRASIKIYTSSKYIASATFSLVTTMLMGILWNDKKEYFHTFTVCVHNFSAPFGDGVTSSHPSPPHREGSSSPAKTRRSTTITMPSTHKMINYNLKQHTFGEHKLEPASEPSRAAQGSQRQNIRTSFRSLSRFPVLAPAAVKSIFPKSHGKMQKQKQNTIHNDIMYFATPARARALAHNTTPPEPKLNTRKYHTFISHLTPFHSIFSLLNLTPSPIVPTFYSPIEESDEALVVVRERVRTRDGESETEGERARITKTEKV